MPQTATKTSKFFLLNPRGEVATGYKQDDSEYDVAGNSLECLFSEIEDWSGYEIEDFLADTEDEDGEYYGYSIKKFVQKLTPAKLSAEEQELYEETLAEAEE